MRFSAVVARPSVHSMTRNAARMAGPLGAPQSQRWNVPPGRSTRRTSAAARRFACAPRWWKTRLENARSMHASATGSAVASPHAKRTPTPGALGSRGADRRAALDSATARAEASPSTPSTVAHGAAPATASANVPVPQPTSSTSLTSAVSSASASSRALTARSRIVHRTIASYAPNARGNRPSAGT